MRYSPEVIYIQTLSSEEIPLLSSGIIANILIAMQINFVKKKYPVNMVQGFIY